MLKLQILLENENRQIVAGIAESYKPDDLTNKHVVIVSNLEPTKLFGEISEGMVLAVEDNNGSLKLLEVGSDVNPGTEVK